MWKLIAAIVAPLYAGISDNQLYIRSAIDARLEYRERQGSHDKALEWHSEWLAFMERQVDDERRISADLQERVSRMEGRHEMLVDRVKDIDDKGSRRWNSGRD